MYIHALLWNFRYQILLPYFSSQGLLQTNFAILSTVIQSEPHSKHYTSACYFYTCYKLFSYSPIRLFSFLSKRTLLRKNLSQIRYKRSPTYRGHEESGLKQIKQQQPKREVLQIRNILFVWWYINYLYFIVQLKDFIIPPPPPKGWECNLQFVWVFHALQNLNCIHYFTTIGHLIYEAVNKAVNLFCWNGNCSTVCSH